ncbi:hypothetical protein M9H77_32024 [Catharanthus roseus]|uniref:Uncharacterized protein n=1 Tax=Catharanthus roseus TaxID=4058 RepID=A0ACC0A1R8_CATRO|nr:hypothetical protein M9H77_32024 [Catharanthus roseus]
MMVGSRKVQLMEERSILKSQSRFVSLTGWTPSDPASDLHITDSSVGINGQDLAQVVESPGNRLFIDSLFTDKSGNNVPGKLWLLVNDVRSDILVFSYVYPNSEIGSEVVQAYIQRFAILGHKTEHKLIDIRIRPDLMTTDEVRWTPYRPEEITDTVWVDSMHSNSSYSPSGTPFMARGTFSSADGDMYQCPCCTTLSVHKRLHALVFVDMISREVNTDDVDSDTKIGRISDMLKKYN